MNATLHSTHTPASSTFSSPLAWLQRAMAGAADAAHAASSHAAEQPQIHVLEAGHTIDVPQPLRHELVCLKGQLWITHDHTPVDVVVECGQCYRPGSGSRMLVHALGDARLMVRTLQA